LETKNKKWWFIASKSDHPLYLRLRKHIASTNIEIIWKNPTELKNIIENKSEKLENSGIILVPGTEQDQEICQWAAQNHLIMMNSPELTSLFKSRWKSFNLIQTQYGKYIQTKQDTDFQRVFFPESWHVMKEKLEDRFGLDYSEKEILQLVNHSKYIMFKRERTHITPHFTSKLIIASINEKNTIDSLNRRIDEQEAVLQEYISSFDGNVIKIYGIGVNLWGYIQAQDEGVIINPKAEDFNHIPSISIKQKEQRITVPIDQILVDFALFLNQTIGLQLFGFDVIQTNENKFYIVDINDFPGYRGIMKAPEKIIKIMEKF
jgi:hypothetical protein